VCVCVYIYICMHVCMCVCMYVCMYVYMCMHTHSVAHPLKADRCRYITRRFLYCLRRLSLTFLLSLRFLLLPENNAIMLDRQHAPQHQLRPLFLLAHTHTVYIQIYTLYIYIHTYTLHYITSAPPTLPISSTVLQLSPGDSSHVHIDNIFARARTRKRMRTHSQALNS
jgi:hypothetical protein